MTKTTKHQFTIGDSVVIAFGFAKGALGTVKSLTQKTGQVKYGFDWVPAYRVAFAHNGQQLETYYSQADLI